MSIDEHYKKIDQDFERIRSGFLTYRQIRFAEKLGEVMGETYDNSGGVINR